MKICTKCKLEKNLTEFSKRKGTKDGLKYECRSCNNIRCKKHLKNPENREKAKKRSKEFFERNKEKHHERSRQWYEDNRLKAIIIARNWNKDNIERRRKSAREWKKKQKKLEAAKLLVNSDYKKRQRKCHSDVCYAVKKGKLIKPENCQKCNEKKTLQAHHEDYYKPLDVIWLCLKCHLMAHNRRVDYL